MLRRGQSPRLSFAPFPRRIPPHPARPTFTPRKRTGDARPQTPSARLPLSRQMQAMPASAACLPPASATADFLPAFSPGGLFFVRSPSDAPAFICAAAHARAESGTDAPRRRRFSLFAPLSPDSKGLSPFFGRRKSFCLSPLLSLRTKDRLRRAKSFVRKRRACKARSVRPAAQTHIFRRTKAKRPAPHESAAQGA